MARAAGWAARLEARVHGARGDLPGDVTGAGSAAWMADRGGRRGRAQADRPGSRAARRPGRERGRRLNYARRQEYGVCRVPARRRRGASSRRCLRCLRCLRWLAGAREPRRSPGYCSSLRWASVSTLATGSRLRVVAAWVRARRTTCSVRLRRWRRRGGGCGIRCGGRVGETLTRWRSPRLGFRSRSRRRPERTTVAISLGCASRRRGCHDAGRDGHAAASLASCASSALGASSASSMTFWWSRSSA